MKLKDLKDKWMAIIAKANMLGVPMPTIRDPKSGRGSVSLTLVWISFNFCILAMVSKWSGGIGGIDPSQAFNLFIACAGLYWGRKFQKDDKGNVNIDSKDPVDKSDGQQ